VFAALRDGRAQPTELRPVVSIFVQFTGISYEAGAVAEAQLASYFAAAQRAAARYGGRVNRLITGDKGSVLHLIFGAPQALEDLERRAALCVLIAGPQRNPLEHIVGADRTVYRPPSSVYRPPSTVLRPPSSVHRPPSTVLRPPSSAYRPARRTAKPPASPSSASSSSGSAAASGAPVAGSVAGVVGAGVAPPSLPTRITRISISLVGLPWVITG